MSSRGGALVSPVVRTLILLTLLVGVSIPFLWHDPSIAAGEVRLVDAFPGVRFERPVFATQAPDGTARMFVVEQAGKIWSVPHPAPPSPGVAAKTLFLDLSPQVSRIGNEEGLIGFAFHPEFAKNGRRICLSRSPRVVRRGVLHLRRLPNRADLRDCRSLREGDRDYGA